MESEELHLGESLVRPELLAPWMLEVLLELVVLFGLVAPFEAQQEFREQPVLEVL